MKEIKTSELKKLIECGGNFLLIDALPQKSFERRHLPSARNIPLKEFDLRKNGLPQDKDRKIITYCGNSNCSTSEKIAVKLEKLGYTNVYRYRDGIKGWHDEGNALIFPGK